MATGGVESTGGLLPVGGLTVTGGSLNSGGASATGGLVNSGGLADTGGTTTSGGMATTGGVATSGGMNTGGMNTGGMAVTGGTQSTGGMAATGGTASVGDSESGVFVGTVAAHNAARAAENASPPLVDLTWSDDLAAFAQDWADRLAAHNDCNIKHRPQPRGSDRDTFGGEFQRYGENIYAAFSSRSAPTTPAADVVAGWSGEIACYTHGLFYETDYCDMACATAMYSNGCGHYTQVVWRETERVGCGRSTCENTEIWVCNYDPPGNYIGELVY